MKLNLASHGDNREGYVNVDFDHPAADLKADVTDLFTIEDESVDEILAFHILEHFRAGHYEPHLSNPLNPRTVIEALAEWKRVLKPGGRLEIKVPDFEKVIWLFQNFPTWSRKPGGNDPFPAYSDWLVSNGQHQCIFDRPTMLSVLRAVGFRDINFVDSSPEAVVNRENIEMYVVCSR
jgi:predicted SAM-dependent methyltransferase